MTTAGNVIIFHGTKSSPSANWFPWLSLELTSRDYDVAVPALPTPEGQSLNSWFIAFDRTGLKLHSSSILVGHSLGATFVLRLLERTTTPISCAILVAGFVDVIGNTEYDRLNESFIKAPFDWGKIRSGASKFICLAGDNDPYVSLEVSNKIPQGLGITPLVVVGGGHLNGEAGFEQFPRLLEVIVGN